MFIIFCFCVVMFLCFLQYRNNWVCTQRIKIINRDYKSRIYFLNHHFKHYLMICDCDGDYDKLPSYKEMIFKFWIWDIAIFLGVKKY